MLKVGMNLLGFSYVWEVTQVNPIILVSKQGMKLEVFNEVIIKDFRLLKDPDEQLLFQKELERVNVPSSSILELDDKGALFSLPSGDLVELSKGSYLEDSPEYLDKMFYYGEHPEEGYLSKEIEVEKISDYLDLINFFTWNLEIY
jgi:hypothetical protein